MVERFHWRTCLALTGLILSAPLLHAQDARDIVRRAVQAEQAADKTDKSLWRYRDENYEGEHNVYMVVETTHGSVKQLIERHGHPLSPAESKAEADRVRSFIHDPAKQQKQVRDSAQDDKNAEELLELLPKAFLWKIEHQDAESWSLHFEPDPNFHPPDMEARVMGAMTGTLIVDKAEHRIRTIKGSLMQDVTIGWGLLGRLRQGGTFDVERRKLAPGIWQITETHVHINGKALLFKTIAEQQDEVKTGFTPVPPSTTLDEAASMISRAPGQTASAASHAFR